MGEMERDSLASIQVTQGVLIQQMSVIIADHETRLRQIEQTVWRAIGAIGIVALVVTFVGSKLNLFN